MSQEVEIKMDDLTTLQLNHVAVYLVAVCESDTATEEQVELLLRVSLELHRRRNRLLLGLIGAPVDELLKHEQALLDS